MSDEDDGHIDLQLLGPPCWRRPGGLSHALAPRDAALLALLAWDGQVPRDRAAAWLWPESPQPKANLSLRQRLFRLRQQTGHALVETGVSLRLAAGVRTDLAGDPLAAEGSLLAGHDFSAFEAFNDWLRGAQQTLGQRLVDALAGQAAALEARGALAEAIRVCERIIAEQSDTEHAWRRLIRLHWLRADRAAAIATFERFEREVCQELGLRPSAETLALLDQVERLDTSAPPPGAALPPGLLHPPGLVGRERELQALTDAWATGRAVLLQAGGGMGKSRLLDAFLQGRPGVLRVRARPGDSTQPYATLTHALAAALDRFAPALAPHTRAELARLLPDLGDAPTAPAQQIRLWQAIEQVWLGCAAAGLQGLVLDDLHWADAASLEQMHWQLASSALAGLRYAFAARPDEATPANEALQRWLGDSLRVLPMTLPLWTADDLGQLLPTLGLPPGLATRAGLKNDLLRQTGGQPFFVLETLKTLVLAAEAGAALTLAPAVGAMVERRIQRLAPDARQLLQLLSVSDGELPLAVAAQALHRSAVALGQDWAELARSQLVHDSGVAHDLVRECVLAALPAPTRQALHLALAEGLATATGIDPARLAPHWQAGQAWAQAGQAWLQAAEAAVRSGRLTEAEQLYDQAAEAHAQENDQSAQVQVLAAAHPIRLLRQGPEATLAALAPHLAAVHAPEPRARLLLLKAETEMARMRADAAVEATAQAQWLLERLPEADPLRIDAGLLHGRALAWSGQIDEGLGLLRRACDLADASDDLRLRLRARCTLNDVLVPAGLRVESVKHQQQAVALARQLGDTFEAAVCTSNLAVHHLLVSDAAGAYAAGRDALQGFAAMGVQHVNRSMCAGVFAIAAAHLGHFDEAMAETRALAEPDPLAAGEDKRLATDPVRRNLRNTLSTIALWRGCLDEAAAWLAPLSDLSDPAGEPLPVRLTGLMARLRWRDWTGGDDRAERAALQALGEAHPALRDDAHYYRGWAPWDPPADALARLDRLAAREAEDGADKVARSLAVAALQVALAHDPADAAQRALALHGSWHPLSEADLGLNPAIYPPAALAALAQGLRLAGNMAAAQACRQQALAWIHAARLPDEGPAARQAFLQRNPVNRALLSQS